MKTISKEMFVHIDKYNKTGYALYEVDMTNHGCVMVAKVTVDVTFDPLDDGELTRREVEMLKAEQAKINGKAYAETKAIQDRIDSLLCLEHKEVAA